LINDHKTRNWPSHFYYLLGALFITLLLGLIQYFNTTNEQKSNSLQSYLDTEYATVIDAIKNNHPKEIDYQLLNASPYDILIQQNDSTAYWNNFITPLELRLKSSNDYAILYKTIKNKYNITLGLDLATRGKLSDFINKKLNRKLVTGNITSDPVIITDFQKKEYKISSIKLKPNSWLNQVFYFFYLLTFILILRYVYIKVFDSKSLPVVSGLGIGILMFVIDYFGFSRLHQETFLASITNENHSLWPNLQSSLIGLVIVTYTLTVLKRSKALQNINSKIKTVLFPFIISFGFIYLCYSAKGLLYSEPLSGLHNNTLQYTSQGIAFLIAFILGISTLFYASLILFKTISPLQKQWQKYIGNLGGILLTLPISYYLRIEIPIWTLYTFVLSYILILELYLENMEKNIVYTIWWIIIFSGFIASVTFYYRLHDSIKVQSETISDLYSFPLEKNDKKAKAIDSLLKTSDIFPQLASLPYPSGLDKDDYESYVKSIISKSGIDLRSSKISIEVVDKQGITLFNNHFSTAYTFVQAIAKANRQTDHIFFNSFDNAYYLQYKIENKEYNDNPLTLSIKYVVNDDDYNVTPESNYIIFKNKITINSNLVDNTDFNIGFIKNIDTTQITKDVTYSVYHPTDEVKIVGFNKIGGLIKPISLFSFIVSISGILLFFISLINTRLRFLPSELDVQFYQSSSLRTKIQLAIIMLIVFSFLIIGIMTSFYFNSVLENYNNNDQKEDVTSIINDIRNSIEGVENNLLAGSTVQAKIDEMAHVHDKNLAFFDSQGKLLEASFTKPKISRVPFDIVRGFANNSSPTPQNRIKLEQEKYTMEFLPVYYKSQRNPYGYLGISYKPINNSSRSIRDFLSTILNVYVFLFLIAGALAIAIGNSITKPLAILSNKLKEFKLGKTNKVLDWDTKDEIGKLINEYNTLTEKLDESVSILARTERDVAWREMAKQVAHEIKNPLTPMKLSIQYLEKAVKSNPDSATEMIERVSSTLIEQINNLNQIANEFSNFATMPKASNEKIIINEIVEAIHDLFRKREDMDIQMTEPIDDLFVFADRNHLVRILNNIVKNAIQAIPTDKMGIINMSLSKVGDMAVVAVKDNGTGIPDDMKDKVFTPNFTTKSSGTGLGLAISANMIESFNGRIYFETKVGTGTEFFVEIPLMRLQDNYPEQKNRVTLD